MSFEQPPKDINEELDEIRRNAEGRAIRKVGSENGVPIYKIGAFNGQNVEEELKETIAKLKENSVQGVNTSDEKPTNIIEIGDMGNFEKEMEELNKQYPPNPEELDKAA